MIKTWLLDSFTRVFPSTPASRGKPVSLDMARNERGSFQVALHNPDLANQRVTVEADGGKDLDVRVRRVGYVSMRRRNGDMPDDETDGVGKIPGYVPDPLLDEDSLLIASGESHAFWFTVTPKRGARAGRKRVTVTIRTESEKAQTLRADVRIYPLDLKPRKDFRVMQWFYCDCILDHHKCELWDKRFWEVLPAYFRNLAEHGQDCVYTPVFTPPLDGDKRPTQLLKVTRTGKDTYKFNWSDVRKYVKLAQKNGVKYFEWTHLFAQWGVKHAIRIFEGQGHDEKLLWPMKTGATSETYRAFLSQFLPAFKKFLDKEKLLSKSYFHVSDEPHGPEHLKNYRKARTVLTELAPWMKVMDALSEIEYGRQKLTDMPVPSIKTALQFVEEGIPCWCYYCCGPRGRYLNRLMDTPLAKIRMNGWLFYRWPFKGFLHWGYNYWNRSQTRELIDVYADQDGLKWPVWAYGDCFVVYPGPDGPVDSIRWEQFAESMQDYRLLQTLGIGRDDKLLAPMKDFENFPKSVNWIQGTRRKLLERG